MYAVIMAGGGGTRLWPLSRAARPKPFLPLLDGRSLLQATVARLAPMIEPRDVFVVTDARYASIVHDQVPELPLPNLLPEPMGRNTAAAVAFATAAVDRPDDEVMIVLPADQRIVDASGFRHALAAAAGRAAEGDLVTLGIQPTRPETGYGYVLATGGAEAFEGLGTFRVERFVEKPTQDRAQELIASGRASWNAGIFVWRRDAVRDGLARHAPEIWGSVRGAVESGAGAIAAVYPSVRSTSIDYALLEPASAEGRVAVVPADVGWSDLGSWSALLEAGGDPDSVQVEGTGEVIVIGGSRSLVHAHGDRPVVMVGVRDTIVVDTPDAVLVCAADAAQDVKQVVERLIAEDRRELV
jgi:mannose-1-phosphate guanylyltransferase